eukprot:6293240-Prymnesium_polylepis.1
MEAGALAGALGGRALGGGCTAGVGGVRVGTAAVVVEPTAGALIGVVADEGGADVPTSGLETETAAGAAVA